jgi:hypothetical protein
MENNTWEVVDLPPGRKPIACKWVFAVKYRADGSIERYKARLVAKGFTQQYGLDYTETFAPVVKYASLRAIIGIAAIEDWEIDQVDFVSAFLNPTLKEDIYMLQPEGFAEGNPHQVLKLKRTLYGLKQSGCEWYELLHSELINLGFRRSLADSNIYVLDKDGTKSVVAVYVDDLAVASSSKKTQAWIKGLLGDKFKMKDLGPLHHLLGVEGSTGPCKPTNLPWPTSLR